VIIDEVEQHLHPKLQRQIVKKLDDKFPKVQFIMTTHSPLCVSGTADTGKSGQERYKVFSLGRTESAVTVHPRDIPRGLRADQILVDYFELGTTLNLATEKKVKQLEKLMSKPKGQRSSRQKAELESLLQEIQELNFTLAESSRDREFQKSALEFLKTQATTK
jgi:chromosome segregation ATPase